VRNNPFAVIPAKVRAWIYLLAVLVGLAITCVQAADGDWLKAIAAIAGTLTGALAASNVKE
jgi:hypothetical protein